MSSTPEPGTEQPRAIVIGHGDFAAGMVSAVQKITGRGASLIALSGQDLSAVQIVDLLRAHVRQTGISVLFTDLQAGSSTMAARRLLRESPNMVLVVGANLAMLLDFVLNTTGTPAEAARHAVERGAKSIAVHGGGQ